MKQADKHAAMFVILAQLLDTLQGSKFYLFDFEDNSSTVDTIYNGIQYNNKILHNGRNDFVQIMYSSYQQIQINPFLPGKS